MGPLTGIRVVEFAGIGPGPFCGMLLADMGADIIRIDRPQPARERDRFDVLSRGKKSATLDLKKQEAVDSVLRLIEKADMLIEGFRPGVMERLGLGPDVVLERNPRIVYGRMTGWGQYGPMSQAAGHDLNYIALAGALGAMGRAGEPPAPPLNLVGDFGGGALYLALGLCAAFIEASRSGRGQVVDAAMADGTASMMTPFFAQRAAGAWSNRAGENILDGGAHFYDTYETKDGKFVSLGSIEPQFYNLLREKAGLIDDEFDHQMDRSKWPSLKAKLKTVMRQKTRAEWDRLLGGTDACYAPVLTLDEAPNHPHNRARATFQQVDGFMQPGPAPRFSRTPSQMGAIPVVGEHNESAFQSWGVDIDN